MGDGRAVFDVRRSPPVKNRRFEPQQLHVARHMLASGDYGIRQVTEELGFSTCTVHRRGIVRLATRLESVNDPRRERYLQLLAVVNGWPAPESLTPVFDWSVQALRVRTQQ